MTDYKSIFTDIVMAHNNLIREANKNERRKKSGGLKASFKKDRKRTKKKKSS